MNKTELIQKVKSIEGLTQDERAYLVNLVNTKKKYGLVWEDKPEEVEEQLRDNLPVLKEVKEKAIVNGDDYPNHILIEGDNLHALTALSFTHEGKIDVIYIDPPYNTGNKDFVYNDSYVDSEDTFKHSKWISFMHKRLSIAKRLLSTHGVIFMSINDYEIHNLKMLSNEIFGESNFISQLIWEQGRKSSASLIANNHEYVLVYAKNIEVVKKFNSDTGLLFREKKQGLNDIYKKEKELRDRFKKDYKEISRQLANWYKEKDDDDPIKRNKQYCWVDDIGVYFAGDISQGTGNGGRFDLLHPVTKKPCKVPSGGWRFNEDNLKLHLSNNRIHFGDDETTVPCFKRYLKETEYEVMNSTFYKDNRGASSRLESLLEKSKPFNNPKDEFIIENLLNSVVGHLKDAVILDFFAGSGTTCQSTINLNSRDNGKRKSILVTNNENGICENVTYERNNRVINGFINSKGSKIEGSKFNNLRYFKSEFVSREPSLKNKRELTQLATELLCIKEDCYNEIKIKIKQAKLFANKRISLLILFDDYVIPQAVELIKGITTPEIKVYVFSMGSDPYTEDFSEVSDKITLCALPDAIYKAYQNVLPKRKRAIPIVEDEGEILSTESSEQLTIL
jgi:adenine-specific DNA-methyltransferase